jgi:hypothetical protein
MGTTVYRSCVYLFSCLLLAISGLGSARAATYLPMSDAELARRAPIIVRAEVVDQSVELEPLDGEDHPFTYTTLRTIEAL